MRTSAVVTSAINAEQARGRANELKDVIGDSRAAGCETLREIAGHLNGLGSIATARSSTRTAAAVTRVLAYLDEKRAVAA